MTLTTAPTTSLPRTLPLRVVTDGTAEEKRCASPLNSEVDPASGYHQCSPTSDDERSALIPTTAELEPLDDATPATIAFAIQRLKTHEDWLEQHEAITVLRQSVVHHRELLTDDHILAIVSALIFACDNLRSALSKNALLALGECFEYLSSDSFTPFLSCPPPGALVDVLLRRATCEKRFLRDAAADDVDKLILYLASPSLIGCASSYAANKNAKIVAIASKIMAHSFSRLKELQLWDVEQFASGTKMRCVYEALAKFRAGKESAARAESMASLRLLGESLGKERFEAALTEALRDQTHAVTCIVAEVFPPVNAAMPQGRRGSLRDRMLQQPKPSSE